MYGQPRPTSGNRIKAFDSDEQLGWVTLQFWSSIYCVENIAKLVLTECFKLNALR